MLSQPLANLVQTLANNTGSALMHVLQYIKGSLDYKITYGGQGNSSLKPYGYVDADYGGDRDTRRSCSGHVLFMAGGPVAWGAKY